jgi:hypothetical protein
MECLRFIDALNPVSHKIVKGKVIHLQARCGPEGG